MKVVDCSVKAFDCSVKVVDLQLTIDDLQLTSDDLQLTINDLQLTINDLQLTSDDLQLTINDLQLTIDGFQRVVFAYHIGNTTLKSTIVALYVTAALLLRKDRLVLNGKYHGLRNIYRPSGIMCSSAGYCSMKLFIEQRLVFKVFNKGSCPRIARIDANKGRK